MRYIADELPTRTTKKGPTVRRKLDELLGVVVHRFGGSRPPWENGVFVYPSTAKRCRELHIPWRKALVGNVYDENPMGVSLFATEVMRWSRHPYPLQIFDGILYQTSPLDIITPHAGAFNRTHLAILITGDHRDSPPPAADLELGVLAAAGVCYFRKWKPGALVALGGIDRPRVLGHDELPVGGTATPGKHCPGAGIHMHSFRRDVARTMATVRAVASLSSSFVLTS